MSTTFTNLQQTQLGQQMISAHSWLTTGLAALMATKGHADLTPAHLTFLNALDCGDTYAAAVARRLGVTRQAVYRSSKEMQKLGIVTLQTAPEDRRQKVIRMTDYGMRVATDARAALDQIDQILNARIGQDNRLQLVRILGLNWGEPAGSTEGAPSE